MCALLALYATCASTLVMPARAGQPPATSTRQQGKQNNVCIVRVFMRALPGKADYCLGLRAWQKGHYDTGLKFFKLAAGWGNKGAQYTLGLIYYNGHHVPARPALGIAWIKLANERRNDPQIIKVAHAVTHYATPAQRAHGEALFQQMLPRYGDKVATARAWRRLHDWRMHSGNNAGCVRLYGEQAAAARRMGLSGMAPGPVRGLFQRIPPGVPSGGSSRAMRTVQTIRAENAIQSSGVCVTFSVWRHTVQAVAASYFQGYLGLVTVGPLKPVPAPASTTAH